MVANVKDRAVIVGAYNTKFSKDSGVSELNLAAQALDRAVTLSYSLPLSDPVRAHTVHERLELALRNLELQESTLETIEANVSAGLAPPLDLQRSRAQVETVRASLAPLRSRPGSGGR